MLKRIFYLFSTQHLSMQKSRPLTELLGDIHCTAYCGSNHFPSHLLIWGPTGIIFSLVKFSLANYVPKMMADTGNAFYSSSLVTQPQPQPQALCCTENKPRYRCASWPASRCLLLPRDLEVETQPRPQLSMSPLTLTVSMKSTWHYRLANAMPNLCPYGCHLTSQTLVTTSLFQCCRSAP